MSVLDLAAIGTTIFAATIDTGVFRSTDDGLSWKNSIPGSWSEYSYWHLAIIGNMILATATLSNTAYLSSDMGNTWQQLFIPTPYNYASGINSLLVYGSNIFAGYDDEVGGIMLSTDTGKTWREIGNMHKVGKLFVFGGYIFAPGFGLYRALLSDLVQLDVHSPPVTISKFTIIANPITSSADFQFDALKEGAVFEFFDLLGRPVLRQQLSAGQAALHLDMQKYPSGIYLARLGGETLRFAKM